jgi:hypothetical protein
VPDCFVGVPSGAVNTERALDPQCQERLLRLVGDLSQDELAVAAGMSCGFASLIEKGSHGVDVIRLIRLAKRWMCRCWSWRTSVLHWLIAWRAAFVGAGSLGERFGSRLAGGQSAVMP